MSVRTPITFEMDPPPGFAERVRLAVAPELQLKKEQSARGRRAFWGSLGFALSAGIAFWWTRRSFEESSPGAMGAASDEAPLAFAELPAAELEMPAEFWALVDLEDPDSLSDLEFLQLSAEGDENA